MTFALVVLVACSAPPQGTESSTGGEGGESDELDTAGRVWWMGGLDLLEGATLEDAAAVVTGAFVGDSVGSPLGSLGDVDGDGLDEWWIGAQGTFAPRGYVTPAVTADLDDQAPGVEGCPRCQLVGDLDGDGAPELAGFIGLGGQVIHVFSGASATTTLTAADAVATIAPRPGWTWWPQTGLGLGDIDGDGLGELALVGWILPLTDDDPRDQIATWVFRGPLTETIDEADALWFDRIVLGAAADIDGDGRSDPIELAEGGSNDADSFVRIYNANTLDGLTVVTTADALVTIVGRTQGDRLGVTWASSDLDGDGLADLMLGAEASSYGSDLAVFLGANLGGAVSDPDLEFSWGTSDGGVRVLQPIVTDFDGDGQDELVISGRPNASSPHEHFVEIFRSVDLPESGTFGPELAVARLTGGSYQFAVAMAVGDLDGDGLPDLALGDPYDETDQPARPRDR
jgi:hypothetical protein